ncbi:hypothetical protein WJN01_07185 [Flavobacteriaceae bacterium SZ-1-7]|uniref:hypothetical protein n=1 Tax=Tamlana sedimenti TaxID=3134126 RepID=UPI003123D044
MKLSKLYFIVFLAMAMISNTFTGQENANDEIQKKQTDSSYFSLSLGYISDAVFLGRKDSISAPYLYPSISYYHKSGFYTTGSFSYLTKKEDSRIDLLLVTLGYNFTIEKFEADLNATKYFFNEDSYNVISQAEVDLTANLSYDFNFLNLGTNATVFFNKDSSSDLFISSEISHDFITKSKKFQISPTLGIHFGSQNFYEEYYVNKRFGSGGQAQGLGQGNGGSTQTTTTSVVLNESEKFGLMVIEFSLPIWYVNKPFAFGLYPFFVIPKTPATLTTETDVYSEDLENTFYFLIGISYSF